MIECKWSKFPLQEQKLSHSYTHTYTHMHTVASC